MSITATVHADTIKLPAGVHLPDGAQVRVDLFDSQERLTMQAWLERARGGALPGVSTDEIMRMTRGEE